MPSAQNASRQYAYVVESTFGTTPVTPATKLFEVVTFDANLNADQLTDPSIRADRQTSFSRRGNLGAEGDIEVVLCPDNYDWALEALLQGTWASNTLKVGSTARSFSIEEGFMDLAQYQVFTGMSFNSMSMTITPDDLVTASFGMIGYGASALSGTSIDASPDPITIKDKFFHEGGTINEGGSAIAFMTSINLEITNNMSGNYALGNTSYRSLSSGKVDVTGTVTALFESAALYNKFKNGTDSSISFTLTAGSPAETLTFNLPKVKYTSGGFTRGTDGPVLVELGFTAVYDTTAQSTIVITRSA